jgi:hypothetical protein
MAINARDLHGSTMNHLSAGVALGTTSTITTTAATNAAIGGKFTTAYGVAANTAITSPTVDYTTLAAFATIPATPSATVIVLGVTGAGLLRAAQGTIVPTATGTGSTAGAFINAPQFPALPDDFCPIAYVLVRNSPNASAFTAFTSSWTATGITTSVTQIANLPDRPQII